MSVTDTRLTTTLEAHPRLIGVLFTLLLLLVTGANTVVAGSGSGGNVGP